MTEIIKDSLIIFILGMLFVMAAGLIFDYFDKRKQTRKIRLQQERSQKRQAMNCNNCERLIHCQSMIAESNQEKLRLENIVDNQYKQINILQSSLAKVRMHKQSVSEDKKFNESD